MKPGYVVLIIVLASAAAAIGFYLMKRLDSFLAENQKKISAENEGSPHDGLRIAFENPVIVSSVSGYLAVLSEAYSDCRFYFFIGTAEQIHCALDANRIDLGFVLSATEDDTSIPLGTNEYYTDTLGCFVELLEAERQYICPVKADRAIEPKKQKMLAELMRSMECTKD